MKNTTFEEGLFLFIWYSHALVKIWWGEKNLNVFSTVVVLNIFTLHHNKYSICKFSNSSVSSTPKHTCSRVVLVKSKCEQNCLHCWVSKVIAQVAWISLWMRRGFITRHTFLLLILMRIEGGKSWRDCKKEGKIELKI